MASKEFISIKKAVSLTGKSEQKMIRLWENNRKTKLVKEKHGKRYIALSLLEKKYNVGDETQIHIKTDPLQTEPLKPDIKDSSTEAQLLVEVLKSQLIEKDKQLSLKDTQITQLIERTREQNNIIFSLEQHQQQLESKLSVALPEVNKADIDQIQTTEKPQINYIFMALVMLLVGVVLIIFYTLLTN
jgi:hypothetical protein